VHTHPLRADHEHGSMPILAVHDGCSALSASCASQSRMCSAGRLAQSPRRKVQDCLSLITPNHPPTSMKYMRRQNIWCFPAERKIRAAINKRIAKGFGRYPAISVRPSEVSAIPRNPATGITYPRSKEMSPNRLRTLNYGSRAIQERPGPYRRCRVLRTKVGRAGGVEMDRHLSICVGCEYLARTRMRRLEAK
jgi:hypothetical protein